MSEEAPAAPEAPKKPKGPLLTVLLLVLNLAASGFTAFTVFTASPAGAPAPPAEPPPAPEGEVVGPVIAMDPFVVNLDEPGQSRYLKLKIEFEVVKPEVETSLTKSKLLIRDTILKHLSGLKLEDTLGAAAKDKLQADIMAKVEAIIGKDKLRRMFFQEFVVQ